MHEEVMTQSYNLLGENEGATIPFRYGRTDFLLTRELPRILIKYATQKTILDYGCGPGLSSRFLKSLGYDVVGVDISESGIALAKQNDPSGQYFKINPDERLPYGANTFDIVVSTFVLFAIPSIHSLIKTFKNIHSVLNPGGVFIAVTGSTELYQRDWLSLSVKGFPENKNPNSGDVCRILLTDIDLLLEDYYWTHEDYVNVAGESGFQMAAHSYPLGHPEDGIPWKDEKDFPPYVFYEFIK